MKVRSTNKTKATEKRNKFVVSWNDEWAHMSIDAGPMTQEEAVKKLGTITVRRLFELGFAETKEEAQKMYKCAADAGTADAIPGLCVNPDFGTSIFIDDCEERIGIVEYDLPGKNPDCFAASTQSGNEQGGVFNLILDFLPKKPFRRVNVWTNGDAILCESDTVNIIADKLKAFGLDGIVTGYYDPAEDAENGESDECTGWYYVSQE